jgi:hypothetical protein
MKANISVTCDVHEREDGTCLVYIRMGWFPDLATATKVGEALARPVKAVLDELHPESESIPEDEKTAALWRNN